MDTDQKGLEIKNRRLSAQEFIEIISSKQEGKYSDFYGPIAEFDRAVVFDNIEIIEDVLLVDSINVKLPIIFLNVKFKNKFKIIDAIFESQFYIVKAVFLGDFEISGGLFKKNFVIYGGDFECGFRLNGGTFEEFFMFEDGNFLNPISISAGVFKGGINIEGGNYDSFFLKGGEIQDVIISGGKFTGSFLISKLKNLESLYIQGGEFIDGFYLHNNGLILEVRVSNSIFYKAFSIDEGRFFHVEFYNATYNCRVNLRDCVISKLYIIDIFTRIDLITNEKALISYFVIRGLISKDSFLKISSSINALCLFSVQNFGLISLNRLTKYDPEKDGEHGLMRFDSSKDIVIDDFLPKFSVIQIYNSDLGKFNIVDCDLSKFGFLFYSSKITETFVTGSRMPREITTKESLFSLPDYQQQRLGYSQIKKIYEARGDRVEANRYYAKEMEAYQATLSWGQWNDFWEKLNLSLNKFSTNYGQSWQRGLGMTLSVSIFFYILYSWSLGFLPSRINISSVNQFGKISSYFLEFLNPIHKADYVAEELIGKDQPINGWARTIEGISRIFIAYFGYQLIQAFRKHGKASG